MNKRHRRAILWTLGLCAILTGPLTYRIWLQSQAEHIASPNLGDVAPFVLRDSQDRPVTHESLRRSVTIVVHVPQICDPSPCGQTALSQAHDLIQWIRDNLMVRYTEEKNPLNLFLTGGGLAAPDATWRVVTQPLPNGSLLPDGWNIHKPSLVVIDPWLVFAGAWPLTSPVDKKTLERVMSRTTFEQYMGNYLSRRTFMGPKRDPR